MISREFSGQAPAPNRGAETITIVSEKHLFRTLGGVETSDWLEARNSESDGCDLQSVSFVLRHPEVMLCDLSNVASPLSYCSSELINDVFDQLLLVADQGFEQDGVRRILGDGLHPEIALSGPTKPGLSALRHSILDPIFSRLNAKDFLANSKRNSRGIDKNVPLIAASSAVQRLYRDFCAFYGQFISPAYWRKNTALNLRTIYEPHDVWSQIAELGDNKLFVVSAGLSLGFGYSNSTGDNRLFFTEVHRQNDPCLLHKTANFSQIYPEPKQGSWVLLDKAYTGGSIQLAAARLREQVGENAKITTVALFPKSLEAVKQSDYIVYAGRLFEVRPILHLLTQEAWHKQLLFMQAS
jgi:hypothetical protein